MKLARPSEPSKVSAPIIQLPRPGDHTNHRINEHVPNNDELGTATKLPRLDGLVSGNKSGIDLTSILTFLSTTHPTLHLLIARKGLCLIVVIVLD